MGGIEKRSQQAQVQLQKFGGCNLRETSFERTRGLQLEALGASGDMPVSYAKRAELEDRRQSFCSACGSAFLPVGISPQGPVPRPPPPPA